MSCCFSRIALGLIKAFRGEIKGGPQIITAANRLGKHYK